MESGSMSQLRHLTRTFFTVETAQPISEQELANINGVNDVKRVDGTLSFSVDPDALAAVTKRISDFG